MAEPTLVEILGSGATQDINTVTISKADLAAVGLTAAASNTGESIFASIILLAQSKLNTTNQEADPDIQVTISEPQKFTNFRNDTNYDQYSYTVNFEKVAPTVVIDPDDF